MKPFRQPDPLRRDEIDRLVDFLKSCKGDKAMNLEELDGFFSALIAGPETVMPSECLPEVFGGDMGETCKFDSIEQANEILVLMNRHWSAIAATLYRNEVHIPLLLNDEHGEIHGNDWAQGFMRGTYLRHDRWVELINDDEYGCFVIPIMMLYHEHDEDPKLRPDPITPEKREKVVAGMAAGLLGAYKYFREVGEADVGIQSPRPRRGPPKVGRNDPCPCGSGKKYKKCCGGATVN